MTRVPKHRTPQKNDVYIRPLKNNNWEIIEWQDVLYIIQDLWSNFVKVKCIWLLFNSAFLARPIKNISFPLDSWFIRTLYNPMWLLDKEWYIYYGKLAPRYKRLFGIYFIKDNSDD